MTSDSVRLTVSNDELVTVRTAQRRIGALTAKLYDDERERYVLMRAGKMVAALAQLRRDRRADDANLVISLEEARVGLPVHVRHVVETGVQVLVANAGGTVLAAVISLEKAAEREQEKGVPA